MTVLDLPSTREEAWRWADLGGLAAAAALAPIAKPQAEFLDLPGAKLLFVDGVLDDAASDLGRVRITAITTDDHALGKRATGTGWSLQLDRQAVTDPIQIVHVATGHENHLPSETVLADDAVADVIETFVGAGWQNRFTRTRLGNGARLMRSVRLLQPAGFVSLREAAEVGAAASLVTVFLGAGGQGSRIDAQLNMVGEGAFVGIGNVAVDGEADLHFVRAIARVDKRNSLAEHIVAARRPFERKDRATKVFAGPLADNLGHLCQI